MLPHVVAHPEGECAVDARLVGELGRHIPPLRHHPAARVAHEARDIGAFLERRRPHHHLSLGVHDEGVAVEHELVLSAEEIHVRERQADVARTAAGDVLALALLVDLVWGGVDDDEKLCARRAGDLRGFRLPGVLAHQQSHAKAPTVGDRRLRPGLKVALLVEHLVVGELRFAVDGDELPARDQRGGVVDAGGRIFRESHDRRGVA